ncbi:MAG: protein-L-isoaspartate(D-aspartate) O-methyltransferase [Thermoanaerobaculia bacterium]
MVRLLRERGGIRDERVLDAMSRVPRHRFVPRHLAARAYGDHALPIGNGQTISQPWVVARMSELLEVAPDHTVLEIGTGSGYQAAVLAHLARRVFSLERVGELATQAIRRLRELALDNVKVQPFDGTLGWGEIAPIDRILVTAAAPKPPAPLLEQLAAGGILVIPEGDRRRQVLTVYRRRHRGGLARAEAEEVAFVPLVGRHGWSEAEAQ